VAEVCLEHGISVQTFYTWKMKYAGLGLHELRELTSCSRRTQAEAAGGGPLAGRHVLQEIVRKKL
jgi:putative transposase